MIGKIAHSPNARLPITAAFIPVEASYLYTSNKIIRREVYQPEEGMEFPTVIVAYCIDFVEVPKDIFERLNEK